MEEEVEERGGGPNLKTQHPTAPLGSVIILQDQIFSNMVHVHRFLFHRLAPVRAKCKTERWK